MIKLVKLSTPKNRISPNNIEGLNGQQANADLIAIFVRLSQWENIPVAMHDTDSATTRNDDNTDYLDNLRGLHKYFKFQSLGFATYPLAFFSK